MDPSPIEEILDLPEFAVINLARTRTEVRLELERKTSTAPCPQCQRECTFGSERRCRTVRDLPILDLPARLLVWSRRARCPSCKHRFWERRSSSLPPGKRWTQRLYETARQECLQGVPLRELERRYGVSSRTIFRWTFERSRGGRPRKLGRVLGIDEFSRRKGHRYCTHIVDLESRRTITVIKGRKSEDVITWLRSRPAEELARVEVVVTDMSKPYTKAVKEIFGEDVQVIDRFHAVKSAVDALDTVLSSIRKQLSREERKELKKLRKSWLKADDKLKIDLFLAREEWLRRFPELGEVLAWIRDFRGWFDRRYQKPARAALQRLIERAEASALAPLHKVAGTLRRWFEPLVRFIRHRFTNGLVEGFNTKIKLIQRMAYGLRNEHNRKRRIQACCGAG